MTVYEDEVEIKRPGVGTKVLVLACAILAVLGSFWAIVWFIRAYVEPPRVMAPSPLLLASRESRPAPTPASMTEAQPTDQQTAPPAVEAQTSAPASAGGVADRWAPMNQFAPPPATVQTAASSQESAPTATVLASPAAASADPDEVVEGNIPAISGPVPLPRRKPVMTAARRTEAPVPRPRPEAAGPAEQSLFTAVPASDERFQ